MDQVQDGGRRPSRPTYIHELDDWPHFRWNDEVIERPLELVSNLQRQIVADASNMGGQSHPDDRQEPDELGRGKQSHRGGVPGPQRRQSRHPATHRGCTTRNRPGRKRRAGHRCRNGRRRPELRRASDSRATAPMVPPAVRRTESCQLHCWPLARRPAGPDARRLSQLRRANHRPLRSPGRPPALRRDEPVSRMVQLARTRPQKGGRRPPVVRVHPPLRRRQRPHRQSHHGPGALTLRWHRYAPLQHVG